MIGYKILTGDKTACYGFRDDYEQAKDLLKISRQHDADATIGKYEYESLSEKVKRLEAENTALRLQQPIQLDGDAAKSFALALESSRLKQENAKLRAQVEKLWPCHFCGKEDARLLKCRTNWGYGWHVTCKQCLSAGATAYSDRVGKTAKTEEEKDEAMKRYAISAWNTRAEPDNKPLTLDELREMSLEPVYIVNENMSWWEIVNFISAEYFHGRIGTELPLNNLGVTWLAYRRPPSADGEKG